jgi:hypothetical protein
MLRLLLDEHISPEVAVGLRRLSKGLVVHALSEWQDGRLLGASDELILQEATAKKLTLVTYDLRTIPNLLKLWAGLERAHGGVAFVDEKTIPAHDIGSLIRALQKLNRDFGKWDWTNRILFLRR